MKEIEIKPLASERIIDVAALDRICLGGLWTEEAYRREIESDKSTLAALHLSSSESDAYPAIIGMGCLWSIVNEAHLTLLGIHPNYQRQGLGQLLLLYLLQDAIARQLEWATLEVNATNLAAINLYQKYGFLVAGTRKNYYQPSGDDALVLWLKNIQGHKFQANLVQWQQQLQNRLSINSYCLK